MTQNWPVYLKRRGRFESSPFSCLVPAIALAMVIFWLNRREPGFWEQSLPRRRSARAIASISLLLWLGVVLAGRWIAYSDYLYFLYE